MHKTEVHPTSHYYLAIQTLFTFVIGQNAPANSPYLVNRKKLYTINTSLIIKLSMTERLIVIFINKLGGNSYIFSLGITKKRHEKQKSKLINFFYYSCGVAVCYPVCILV